MKYEVEIVEKRTKTFIVEAPEMDDRKRIAAGAEHADAEGDLDDLEVEINYDIEVFSYDGPRPANFRLGDDDALKKVAAR